MDIYLDHNATTPVRPEAAAAVAEALAQNGNASSVHRHGRLARRTIDDARESVAALVDAPAANLVFTSGGTEANNQALRGVPGALLVSAVEHDSVLGARDDANTVAVDGDGVLDLARLGEELARRDGPGLVSVMLANNETGVLQPGVEIAAIAHEHDWLVHCDAVQAAGKIEVSFRDLGVDLMSVSAHKLGGPQGVGALVVRDGLDLAPLMRGGGQERRRRAGTENRAGITGFGVAAAMARQGLDAMQGLASLRDEMEARILAAVPEAVLHGAGVERMPNTSCIGLPSKTAETQVIALDLAGVAVSAGSACSSGKVTPSHVLRAMGLDDNAAQNAIRVSLGWNSSAEDVDRFVDAWTAMANGSAKDESPRRSVA